MSELIIGLSNDRPVTLQRGEKSIMIDCYPAVVRRGWLADSLPLILGEPRADRLVLNHPIRFQLKMTLLILAFGASFFLIGGVVYWASMWFLGVGFLIEEGPYVGWIIGLSVYAGLSGLMGIVFGILDWAIWRSEMDKWSRRGYLQLQCSFVFYYLLGVFLVAYLQERPFFAFWSWIELFVGVLSCGLAAFLLMGGMMVCLFSLIPYQVRFDRQKGVMTVRDDYKPVFPFKDIVAVQLLRFARERTTRWPRLVSRSSAIESVYEVNLVLDLPIKRWTLSLSLTEPPALQLGRSIADFLRIPLVIQTSIEGKKE